MNEPISNHLARQTTGPAMDDEHSIGEVLVSMNKLTLDEVDAVLQERRAHGELFGQTAVRLGLLDEGDLREALSRQFRSPGLGMLTPEAQRELPAAFSPGSAEARTYRRLRTELLIRWFDDASGHTSLTIASAQRGEGRTRTAANLGIVFAQLGKRTLLVDADLENPRLHRLFDLRNVVGLSTVLSERSALGAVQRAPGQMDLSVLTSGPQPPNPHELLSREPFYALLDQVRRSYDIVLIDTTAYSLGADAQSVAARTGGALLVVRQGTTTNAGFGDLMGAMQSARATVVGAVMNRF